MTERKRDARLTACANRYQRIKAKMKDLAEAAEQLRQEICDHMSYGTVGDLTKYEVEATKVRAHTRRAFVALRVNHRN